MANTSVVEDGFPLDDLRVEELEPRLEFTAGGCWVIDGVCTFCMGSPTQGIELYCLE
ncbi:hypothetical protein ACFLIM_36125 [Nonomuraea sp. M3C6]|uniref:Uncharacterized protein n=1 Tax=Nonomuraea marmarensis TaxID=3351344 RepID=A0ABW7AMN1_9ACTN